MFSLLDIKPLMIAANLTFGDVIWLLFELVLIVLRTRTNKKVVINIEIALYKPPFQMSIYLSLFLYKEAFL